MNKILDKTKQWMKGISQSNESVDLGPFAVIMGLIIIGFIFQLANENFLTPLNITNLLSQIAAIGILSVGTILVLLIGEIDLSIGAVSGATAAIMAVLITTYNVPSIFAIFAAIIVGMLIGALQGVFIVKVNVPSFVVTLAGQLIWQGVQLFVLGDSGTINLRDPLIQGVANALVPPWLGWVIGIVAVSFIVIHAFVERNSRIKADLPYKPLSLAIGRVALISAAILTAVGLMNIDRSQLAQVDPIRGIPAATLIFISFVVVFHIVTTKTVFGRHVFTIGGNVEAARRAGIRIDKVRIWVFALCSGIAACGGIVAASRLIAVNYGSGGGSIVLNAIAAAVIGGTSLFGGKGRVWAALLGGLVIGSISNGMDLLSFPSSTKFIVTGTVLLLSVIIDATSRQRRTSE